MLARLLLLLAVALLFLQGVALKPLVNRLGEVGVLLLATTACVSYDWAPAAAGAFSGQAWCAYLICTLSIQQLERSHLWSFRLGFLF